MYRNRKLLEILRKSPCQECGREDGTVVAAHSNQLRDGKGRGIKADDNLVAALCLKCHYEIDQGNTLNKEERQAMWVNAHKATIGRLIDQGAWPDDVPIPEILI
jgi:ribosomal protein S27AE